MAGLPVSLRILLPNFSVSQVHSASVDLSIQIGATARERIGFSWSARVFAGSQSGIGAFRYTEPCCWPEPEMPAICAIGKPAFCMRSNSMSMAATHMRGSAQRTLSSSFGRYPLGELYSGRSFLKLTAKEPTTLPAAVSMTSALRPCVLESRPR